MHLWRIRQTEIVKRTQCDRKKRRTKRANGKVNAMLWNPSKWHFAMWKCSEILANAVKYISLRSIHTTIIQIVYIPYGKWNECKMNMCWNVNECNANWEVPNYLFSMLIDNVDIVDFWNTTVCRFNVSSRKIRKYSVGCHTNFDILRTHQTISSMPIWRNFVISIIRMIENDNKNKWNAKLGDENQLKS